MHHFLVFQVAGRSLGLSANVLREAIRAVAIAALPKAPSIVEGVINVRGTLVPVLDIRQRFGLPPTPVAPEQHFLIAQTDSRLVALRVDRALDLVGVEESAIESAAHVAPGVEHVAGIAKLADGLLVIHDLERFLSLDEAGQVDAAVVGATTAGEPSPPRKGRR
ncbi:MAG TPA: chemotaxis protein CheW [Gemmatimonadales bacterium]|nr:chemotaxis protein CheW [Gemmatimonadales bacterium]